MFVIFIIKNTGLLISSQTVNGKQITIPAQRPDDA